MQDESQEPDISESDSMNDVEGANVPMVIAESVNTPPAPDEPYGNGSIAHQIIGRFVKELEAEEGYADIAKKLSEVIFFGKPTEAELKTALFGEIEL